MDNRPIGIFDSGLGGLTCIPYMIRELPEEKMIYFGDTKRAPYGSKKVSTIINFSTQIVDFLVGNNVKMIVIACNTVSAVSFDRIKEKTSCIPLVGIIKPAIDKIAEICPQNSRIGVIGTKATVMSGIYNRFINELNNELSFFSIACPKFVPLIEDGDIDSEKMDFTIRSYMDEFIGANKIDTIVLGCTHYSLIKGSIERIYPGIRIIDPSLEVTAKIKTRLTERGLLARGSDFVNTFYASDLSDVFTSMIGHIFQDTNIKVKFRKFEL